MKPTTLPRMLATLVVAATSTAVLPPPALADGPAALPPGAPPVTARWRWDFPTAANPAVAVGVPATAGEAQAEVGPGEFTVGWQDHLSGLGPEQGLWDLGRRGSLRLVLPAVATAPVARPRELTVRVEQYVDGGIYRELAVVSVGGAEPVTEGLGMGAEGAVGGWLVDVQRWRVRAGEDLGAVQITGSDDGTVVTAVAVEWGEEAAPTLPLAIRPVAGVPGEVELVWSAALGDCVLESRASASVGAGAGAVWQPVTAPVQLDGTQATVRLPAAGPTRFFRLTRQ